MQRKTKRVIVVTVSLILLLFFYFYLIGPFLVILTNAFKTTSEINSAVPTFIPKKPVLSNFKELFSDDVFVKNIQNSFKIALITMVLAIMLAIPTAYSMARFRNKLTSGMIVWILLSQMIPGIIMVVPIYNILKGFSLTNTHAGLIICYAVWSLPFSCWMLRGFIGGVPKELEEAAQIDGCNTWQVIQKILIPVILPGILTAGVFAFINAWNELFFALCLMKTQSLQTLPIKLQSYIGLAGNARDGMVAAGSLISTIPGLIVFMCFQKFLVTGLTSGSVK